MTLLLNTALVDHDSDNETLNTSVQDDSKWESTFSVRNDKIHGHDHDNRDKPFESPTNLLHDPHIILNNSKFGTMATQFITIQTLSGKYLNDLWVPSQFIADSIERSCDFAPTVIPHPVKKHSDNQSDFSFQPRNSGNFLMILSTNKSQNISFFQKP